MTTTRMQIEDIGEGDEILIDGEWLTVTGFENANPGWARIVTSGGGARPRIVSVGIDQFLDVRY